MYKAKELFAVMYELKNKLREADKNQLWEYYHPEDAAKMDEINFAQEKYKIKFCKEYIDFLLCSNGWRCFYQLVDLLGTKDFETEKMEHAKRLLSVEIQYNDALNRIKDYLFPIAASRTDKDLFVMVLKEGKEYGQIIWLAGGEIERFESFNTFFESMIGYNQEELEDIVGENSK